MKKRSVLIVLIICLVLPFAVAFSGCLLHEAKTVDGVWEIDLNASDKKVAYAFKSAKIVVDAKNSKARIEAEFTDEVDKIGFYTGTFNLDTTISNYSNYLSIYEYDYQSDMKESILSLNIYYEDVVYAESRGDVDVTFNKTVGDYKAGEIYVISQLVFVKSGSASIPIDPDDPNFNPNPNPNPKPDDPNPPQVASKHEDIKKQYKNAGYTVDVSASDVDPSTAALIKSMQDAYAQLGIKITVIGKNLSSVSFDTEMYMLISADSESVITELVQEFEGTYEYAKKGRDIIVSIWPLGTPNFAPFNQTV